MNYTLILLTAIICIFAIVHMVVPPLTPKETSYYPITKELRK